MDRIAYRELPRWKYRLETTYRLETDLRPTRAHSTGFVRLDVDGVLEVRAGYSWDGPSGPTRDVPEWMRASLVHDAIYQLLRETGLDQAFRLPADRLMREQLLEDGMRPAKAAIAYYGVRWFGKTSAAPRRRSPVIYAPM